MSTRTVRGRAARRAAGRRGTSVAVLALILAVTAGCATTGPDVGAPDAAGPADAPPQDAPLPDAPPSDTDPVPPLDCDEAVRAAVGEVVAAQLGALGAGDLAGAYGFASESFRAAVPLERFEVIIRDGYAALLTLERHELLDCRSDGSRTAAVVGIVADDGTPALLAYDLVLEGPGWRVRGAQLLGADGPPALEARTPSPRPGPRVSA